MADNTAIEWTDATWNPVTGCTEVSPGCDHCYAKTFAERWRGIPGHHFEQGFDVVLRPERLDQPLRWKKPKRIFVNSMSDLFHDDVPAEFIARVFAVMTQAPQHTFQVLTKRHGRMRSLLNSPTFHSLVDQALGGDGTAQSFEREVPWPLLNVWLGVSVENQQWADIRIPALLETPAAVRFLSCEPLLGPVDLWIDRCSVPGGPTPCRDNGCRADVGGIDWVIVGGESGRCTRPGRAPLRDQCAAAGVPFLFKQFGAWMPIGPDDLVGAKDDFWMRPDGNGEYYSQRYQPGIAHMVRVGKKAAGRELDGHTHDEFPKAVTVA